MESIFDSITVPGAGYSGAGVNTVAAGGQFIGSTGLIASVEATQFEKLVRDAVDPVVLCMGTETPPIANGRPVPKRTGKRYVMACSGIVWVTQSVRPLEFGSSVRTVDCQAIVYENKPLGGNNV